jgi:outer membrane protein OmpA-like peptidoglycan-associated protein
MKIQRLVAVLCLLVIPAAPSVAQEAGASGALYSLKIESGATKAINYPALGGSASIDFRGTPLEPNAAGEAKVKAEGSVMRIDASFRGLGPASKYGPEYMTYVLWAISPEGRPSNLGEVILSGGKAKMSVTTRLQMFALVVTAEPYFAVTQVGNVVVLENVARGKDAEKTEDVRYDRLQRGQYTLNMDPADLQPAALDKRTPPELYQARNAVKIARAAEAEKYAADAYRKGSDLLAEAEAMLEAKKGKQKIAPVARQATQTAEDARRFAVSEHAEQQAEQERLAMAAKVAEAQKAAAASEAQKAQAERSLAAAESEAEQARRAAAMAEQEKAQIRAQLRQQLSAIMETRDDARGLIVSVAGLNFETGKATLLPAVREKLARISGILLSQPGLKLEVEGYTDSTGSDEFNQKLSQERAQAVKDYLTESGVPAAAIDARGFGKAKPIASNDTAEGRQQNRRVDIVVSGDAIASGKG